MRIMDKRLPFYTEKTPRAGLRSPDFIRQFMIIWLAAEFGHSLGRNHQPVPIVQHILRRPPFGRDVLGHLDGRHHLDRVPRADRQFVGVGFFRGNMHADFAAHAPFHVDFAERLQDGDRLARNLDNAIDGQTSRHASQPVQLSALMTATSLGSFFRPPALRHLSRPFPNSGTRTDPRAINSIRTLSMSASERLPIQRFPSIGNVSRSLRSLRFWMVRPDLDLNNQHRKAINRCVRSPASSLLSRCC